MQKSILERYWKPDSDLSEHKVVSGVLNEIRHDIRAGHVFPALRENEIHLYHEGGRALRIRPKAAYSHGKYACGSGTRDVSLRKPLTKESYEQLKSRCSRHNNERLKNSRRSHRETWIVSRLFQGFSVWADGTDPSQPRLIDVEVRLREGKDRSVEMVDLLFLDHDACLMFVEVKRQYDSRVRSRDQETEPEVIRQVRGYQAALEQHQTCVLAAYREVGDVVSRAFGLESKGFEAPKEVFPRVPVLVCRRDDKSGWDRWLKARLAHCEKGGVDPCHLVADGGAVVDAEAVYSGNQPPWCADGVWGHVDLRMLFAKIRSGRPMRCNEYSMRVARYVLSWLLYWMGHALSVPMRFGPFAFLYHPYNRVILASVSCQGGAQRGPWREPTESAHDPGGGCACTTRTPLGSRRTPA